MAGPNSPAPDRKQTPWAHSPQKFKIISLTLIKFGSYTNSNMQKSMVMFTFTVFGWKYTFWENFVQKTKIWYLD